MFIKMLPTVEVEYNSCTRELVWSEDEMGYMITSVGGCFIQPGETFVDDTGVTIVTPEGYYCWISGSDAMLKRGLHVTETKLPPGSCNPLRVRITNVWQTPIYFDVMSIIGYLRVSQFVKSDLKVMYDYTTGIRTIRQPAKP